MPAVRGLILVLLAWPVCSAGEERLRLATTTSTDNSGLLATLHPPFEERFDVRVAVIAVGTGKALKLGENGDVDLVFVHAPAAELRFVEAGFGIERLPVMHNDFVLLGPETDPGGVRHEDTLRGALARLARGWTPFVSRGDDSGTHKKELALWAAAGIEPAGRWYLSVGQGMGAVLKIASDKRAYALSDRGTYLAYTGKVGLAVVFEGARELHNPYHVILVNPGRHPHVRADLARKYVGFIRSGEGQRLIRDFEVAGERLFHPDVLP